MTLNRVLIGFITLTLYSNINAQEVRIKAIPYPLKFENVPLSYNVTDSCSLSIVAPGKTDLFISPDGRYKVNKSPRLIFKPDSDFIFSARIEPDFKTKWDAGVLLVYNDETHFAKFCFEVDYKGTPRVVTVVCNETADDCNSMAISSKAVYYRMSGSARGKTFNFYYSSDGKDWYLVRAFKLDKVDNLRIGFSAQSSVGKECNVGFSEIDLQQRKLNDFWKGN
jgi:Uncharacterized conserved protein